MYRLVLYLTCICSAYQGIALQKFIDFCEEASRRDDVFANFKCNVEFTEALEHLNRSQGQDYLLFIENHYPDLIVHFDQFRSNDLIGNPTSYDYGIYGTFSPTTLRYIKVLGDLKTIHKNLGQMHILEIGAGYGGQCKILSDLIGFASYTMIDYPEVLKLAKRYIETLGIKNVRFVSKDRLFELKDEYDLVISNYSFLEIEREKQEGYYPVLLKAKHGYMTGYFPLSSRFISQQEFKDFADRGKLSVRFNPEVPLTGGDNLIITWNR